MIDEILNLPDISFIDDKQLEEVQSEMTRDYQNRYKEITGKEVVLDRADPMSLILYALSVQVYQAMLYVDKTGKQDLLKYSYGPYLDNLAAMKGIARESAKPSRAMVRFTLAGIRQTHEWRYLLSDRELCVHSFRRDQRRYSMCLHDIRSGRQRTERRRNQYPCGSGTIRGQSLKHGSHNRRCRH